MSPLQRSLPFLVSSIVSSPTFPLPSLSLLTVYDGLAVGPWSLSAGSPENLHLYEIPYRIGKVRYGG